MPAEGLPSGVLGGSGAALGGLGTPFWSPGVALRGLWAACWLQVAAKMAPRGRQVGPRGPKRPPEGRQGVVFGAEKWPQEAPKSHRERHKTADVENLKIDDPLNENA